MMQVTAHRPGLARSSTQLLPTACQPISIRPARITRRSASSTAGMPASTSAEVLASVGMAPYQVDRVSRELERLTNPVTADWVLDRVQLIRAALGPSVLAEALYNGGVELLQKDISTFPAQLIKLTTALAGDKDVDVQSIIAKEPKLLWAVDVEKQVPKVIKKLVQVYPYKAGNKKAEVLKLVQEYPELLVRMPYYCDDPKIKTVQDLPVDLQNRISKSHCG